MRIESALPAKPEGRVFTDDGTHPRRGKIAFPWGKVAGIAIPAG